MTRSLPILCALAALFSPTLARAADDTSLSSHHINGVRFDLHADVGGYASVGAGFRADIPILRNGLLAGADDELAISPGIDVYFANLYHDYYNGGPYLVPSVVAQWNFYLGEAWSVFPEAGIALYVGDGDALPRGLPVYATLDLGLGARYHLNARNALLLRISRPTGIQLGLTF